MTLGNKYSFDNLSFGDYDYSSWFEELHVVPQLPPQEEDDGEVKKETRIIVLTLKNQSFLLT